MWAFDVIHRNGFLTAVMRPERQAGGCTLVSRNASKNGFVGKMTAREESEN
jgi:hypothetical protein